MTEQNIWLAYVMTDDDPEIVGVFKNKRLAVLAMFDYLYGTDRIFSLQRERYERGKLSLLRDNRETNLSNIIQSCQDYNRDEWWSYTIKKQPIITENKDQKMNDLITKSIMLNNVNTFRRNSGDHAIGSNDRGEIDHGETDTNSEASDVEIGDDAVGGIYESTWNEVCDDAWDEVYDSSLDNTGWDMVTDAISV